MTDKKSLKNNSALVIVLGLLGLLVLINIIMNFQDRSLTSVTGLAVGVETADSGDGLSTLRNENERLVLEKNTLSKEIEELEAKIKVFEDEKELEEETCPLPCSVDEICSPINKKDGSVEWQCVDDPKKFV